MSSVACERNLPLKIEEEKQGIVSVLGSYSQVPKPPASAAASFRRTLSADMSSKKWLAENGFNKPPAMKRNSSSAQLSFISAIDHRSSSSEEEEEELDCKKYERIPKQDLWSSIVSQKKTEELPPPYVHHLLKKSSSSLSLESLEICTEGLGSETGSDKVTLDTGSDKAEESLEPLAQQESEISQNSYLEETTEVVKYNYPAISNKKLQPKSFPPPIPSLAGGTEGASVQMHSQRQNGRLVLKAVSSPSTKKLKSHRQDGRLLLTFIQPPKGQQHVQQPDSEKAVLFDEEEYMIEDNLQKLLNSQDADDIKGHDYEITNDNEEGINELRDNVTKQEVPKLARGVINIHRSALMMKKMMGMENQNPTWSQKFHNAAVETETENEEEKGTKLPQSLPPRPRTTRSMPTTPPPAASFNAYEYFWRIKPAASGLKNPYTHCSTLKKNTFNNTPAPSKPKPYERQELPALRTCRKARRSLLSWDGYCIATI